MTPLKKILHVDDDADIREIAELSLEQIGGFEVRQCASGAQALDVAPVFKPDLFLFDVMMPQMSGDVLWQELSVDPEMAKIPVIFMTAKVERSYIDQLRAKGAIAVLEKPFDPIGLADEIRAIWAARSAGT